MAVQTRLVDYRAAELSCQGLLAWDDARRQLLGLGHDHIAWIPLAVAGNEAPNLLSLLNFCRDAVMLGTNRRPPLAGQFARLC